MVQRLIALHVLGQAAEVQAIAVSRCITTRRCRTDGLRRVGSGWVVVLTLSQLNRAVILVRNEHNGEHGVGTQEVCILCAVPIERAACCFQRRLYTAASITNHRDTLERFLWTYFVPHSVFGGGNVDAIFIFRDKAGTSQRRKLWIRTQDTAGGDGLGRDALAVCTDSVLQHTIIPFKRAAARIRRTRERCIGSRQSTDVGSDYTDVVVGTRGINFGDELGNVVAKHFLLWRHRGRVVDYEKDVNVLLKAGADIVVAHLGVALTVCLLPLRFSRPRGDRTGAAEVRRGTSAQRESNSGKRRQSVTTVHVLLLYGNALAGVLCM